MINRLKKPHTDWTRDFDTQDDLREYVYNSVCSMCLENFLSPPYKLEELLESPCGREFEVVYLND